MGQTNADAQKPRNPLRVLLGVLLKPRSTFAYLGGARRRWWWVVALLMVAALVVMSLTARPIRLSYQRQLEY